MIDASSLTEGSEPISSPIKRRDVRISEWGKGYRLGAVQAG